MTSAVAIAAVLFVLVAVNLWVHLGPTGWHLVTGPLAALLVLFVARWAGLTWPELGLGQQSLLRGTQVAVAAILTVALVYAAGVAIPFTRAAFRDTRYRLGLRAALYTSLVAIPLGTVLFEEVAFRSVLWGLLARDFGFAAATVVSACLFGLWHVLPALNLARTHTSVRGQSVAGGRRVAITVLATIVFTTVAGIVFAQLRSRSGSLVAPIGLHWATNGLGVLAAARVWAVSTGDVATPGEVATGDTSELTGGDTSGAATGDTSGVATGDTSGVAASDTAEVATGDPTVARGTVNQPVWQRVVRRLSSRSEGR